MNNENGMSIVQVLIVLGILVAAMFAGLQIVVNSKSYSEITRQTIEMSILQAEINNALLNEDSCRMALGGPLLSYISTGNVPVFTGNEQKFTIGAGTANLKLYRTVATALAPQGQEQLFLDPSNASYNKFGPLTITGLSLNNYAPFPSGQNPIGLVPAGSNLYVAKMTITATRSGIRPGFDNPPIIRSDIVMTVQTDSANRIISCSSVTFTAASDGSVGVPPFCLPGQALYTHNGGVSCVQVECQNPTPTASGWNADGTPNCTP